MRPPKGSKGLCPGCKKRATCTEICDKLGAHLKKYYTRSYRETYMDPQTSIPRKTPKGNPEKKPFGPFRNSQLENADCHIGRSVASVGTGLWGDDYLTVLSVGSYYALARESDSRTQAMQNTANADDLEKKIIHLKLMENLSHAEIAERLCIKKTVSQLRFSRAMRRIRADMMNVNRKFGQKAVRVSRKKTSKLRKKGQPLSTLKSQAK